MGFAGREGDTAYSSGGGKKRRGDNSTVGLLAIPLFAVSVRT